MKILRVWDTEFQDFTAKLMPERFDAPEGAITNFHYPVTSGIGVIAPVGDENAPARFIDVGITDEVFWTRQTSLGAKINVAEFNDSIAAGKMGVSFGAKMKEVMKGIARRIMLDRLNYMAGDSAIVGRFSTQSTDRLKTWDLSSTSDMGSGSNQAGSWSTLTTDLMWQFNLIGLYAGSMGDTKPNQAHIGPNANFYVSQNTTLRGVLDQANQLGREDQRCRVQRFHCSG
jgi:hypothetical protein